jgi:hypothetical protein
MSVSTVNMIGWIACNLHKFIYPVQIFLDHYCHLINRELNDEIFLNYNLQLMMLPVTMAALW